jgi:hypothetical protein
MSPSYDPLWYARQDIETRTRPYPDAYNFVIDVAIEVVRQRVSAANENVVAYLSDLFATGVPVIQRLAIASIRNTSIVSADEKLRWLLTKRILHSFSFRTETIKLFELNLRFGSEAVKSEIVEATLSRRDNRLSGLQWRPVLGHWSVIRRAFEFQHLFPQSWRRNQQPLRREES